MTALHHEGARDHQPAQLGVVEGVAQVELGHVVLAPVKVAVGRPGRDVLPDPLVVVGRANAQAVAVDDLRDAHGCLAAVAQPVEGHARGIHEVLRGQPIQDDLVLALDERPERELQRLGLAQHLPEAVLADVAVLRGEGHEPALGQSPRVGVVGPGVDARIGHVGWPTFEPMLADHHRPLLPGPDPARHDQDAVGHHVGMHVEHHLVGGHAIGLDELAGPRCRRQRRRGDDPEDVALQEVAVGTGAPGKGLGVLSIGLLPELCPRELGLTHEPLGVLEDLRILPQLARGVVGQRLEGRDLGGSAGRLRRSEPPGEGVERLVVEELLGLGGHKLPLVDPGNARQPGSRLLQHRARDLGIRATESARCGPLMRLAGLSGVLRLGETPAHPDQAARGDQTRDLARTELVGQRPDVAVDGLVVQAWVHMVAADGRGLDAGIQGAGKTRDHPALAVADHPHRHAGSRGRLLRLQPIHGRQHLLDLVALHGAAHLVGGPPQHLALRLLELAHSGQAAVGVGPVDQRGDEHTAAALGQPTGELVGLGQARLKTGDLLGRLVGVGDGHHRGLGLAVGHQHQALGLHAPDDGPGHRQHTEPAATTHLRWMARGRDRHRGRHPQLRGRPAVHHAEDAGQVLPVGLDGPHVGLGRGEIPVPVASSGGRRSLQHTVEVTVDAADQGMRQVAGLGERLGAREHGRRRVGGL